MGMRLLRSLVGELGLSLLRILRALKSLNEICYILNVSKTCFPLTSFAPKIEH